MNPLPCIATTLSFIDCINRGDLDGLVELMTDAHALRILSEPPVVGCDANRKAWRGYMTAFPHYVIYPQRIAADGSRVAILGSTTGSHLGLPDEEERKLPVLWVATVENGKVSSWAIVEDSPTTRTGLGVNVASSSADRGKPETLHLVHAQGSLRYALGARALNGGDLFELCCSGGWLTGRFEWDGRVDAAPRFFFSIELEGGKVAQHSLEIPEGALLRRV